MTITIDRAHVHHASRIGSLLVSLALAIVMATPLVFRVAAQKTLPERLSTVETQIVSLSQMDSTIGGAISGLQAQVRDNTTQIDRIQGAGAMLAAILTILQVVQVIAGRKK